MSAKTENREEQIMRLLLGKGSATIEEMLASVNTSAPSIRRDLNRLENRGLVRRTHGGAMLVEPLLYEPFRYDTSFQAREQRAADEKRRIALAAADLIQPHETVGITAGTTTTQVGRALRHRNNINVVTNAINIGMELCNQSGMRTSITGGVLPYAWSFSLTGAAAIRFMDDVYLDKVFLNVVGIDAERGCTTLEQEEALTFRAMVRQAREVIVVADSTKIGRVSTSLICPVKDVHTLVTDTGATDEALAPLIERGIRIVRA
ncbi:DeoR/GlpR family DNA-binding transcription regulator [Acidipila sp. EB88]|uniref:DeoR/GlpR family DNA-binding transcription regulator n=1 Tax=Acidipila sp. EB88 TaxID=2305226 RepID=UPI000F5D716E|nr:DeoR/GlpR family DNA-binding transcription regulator [Acidipila sp. EB88]RRA47262.1 DeoR/GlpR transcriptional regulator [Acidipila sp. EB88]